MATQNTTHLLQELQNYTAPQLRCLLETKDGVMGAALDFDDMQSALSRLAETRLMVG